MIKRWQDADGVHMDLRGLLPPEPMIEILREIDDGADGPLIVLLDRDPIFLYQELEERGWMGLLDEKSDPAGTPVTLLLKPDAVS